MLSSIFATLLFSYLASLLFNKGMIPERLDIFKVKTQRPSNPLLMHNLNTKADVVKVQNESELMLNTDQE